LALTAVATRPCIRHNQRIISLDVGGGGGQPKHTYAATLTCASVYFRHRLSAAAPDERPGDLTTINSGSNSGSSNHSGTAVFEPESDTTLFVDRDKHCFDQLLFAWRTGAFCRDWLDEATDHEIQDVLREAGYFGAPQSVAQLERHWQRKRCRFDDDPLVALGDVDCSPDKYTLTWSFDTEDLDRWINVPLVDTYIMDRTQLPWPSAATETKRVLSSLDDTDASPDQPGRPVQVFTARIHAATGDAAAVQLGFGAAAGTFQTETAAVGYFYRPDTKQALAPRRDPSRWTIGDAPGLEIGDCWSVALDPAARSIALFVNDRYVATPFTDVPANCTTAYVSMAASQAGAVTLVDSHSVFGTALAQRFPTQ